jgi:hypothetical protein
VPKRIFISYRREDTAAEARSVYQRLERSFGSKRLFMDVDSIIKGRDFNEALAETLQTCAVMLAIIGRNWLSAHDDAGKRRLDDPNDFVRLEIAAALKRNIPIIPVRVEGVRVPAGSELPEDIKRLAMRQAAILTHENFSGDMSRIERDLKSLLTPKLMVSRLTLLGLSLLAVVCLALYGLWWQGLLLAPHEKLEPAAVRQVPPSEPPKRVTVEGAKPLECFNGLGDCPPPPTKPSDVCSTYPALC